MSILSNSSLQLVRVTSVADLPSIGTAEFVMYCIDNGTDPEAYKIWRGNSWETVFVTGGAGTDGADGVDGSDGNTILNGVLSPGGLTGVDGDFYLNTVTNTIFGPKVGSSWGTGTSLNGPTGLAGPTGAQGPIGATGPQGTPGISPAGLAFKGLYNPATTYVDDDVVSYNGSSYWVWNGPVTGVIPTFNGAQWALLATQGATGAAGPTGPTGLTGLTGPAGTNGTNGAPGTNGTNGARGALASNALIYINGTTGSAGNFGANQSLMGSIAQLGMNKTSMSGYSGTVGATNNASTWVSSIAIDDLIQVVNINDSTIYGIYKVTFIIDSPTNTVFNVLALFGSGSLVPSATLAISYSKKGATGATGATGAASTVAGPTGLTGAAGANGANGANGKTILTGSTSPSGGTDGDFYLTTGWKIFGPKVSGSWPATGTQLSNPWEMPLATTAQRLAIPLSSSNLGYQVYDLDTHGVYTVTKTGTVYNTNAGLILETFGWKSPTIPDTFTFTSDFAVTPVLNGSIIYCTNTSALTIYTLPSFFGVEGASTGFSCIIVRQGVGEVTFFGGNQDTSENLYSTNAEKKLRVQYSFATLTKKGNDWFLGGDLKV